MKRKLKANRQYNYTSYINYKLVPLDYCEICNENDKEKLTRHHIIQKKDSPKNIDNFDNIIILCNQCHQVIHNTSDKKNSKWIKEKYNKIIKDKEIYNDE